MSKSQQSQRVVRKLVENTRPVKVKVVRGSRGIRYEVTVSGRDVEDAMALLQQAEEKLNARYGSLHVEQSPRTEQKIVEREFAIARNGMIYGTISLTSEGVRIIPGGIRVYITDGPVGWLIKKFLPSFTKNAKINVEEREGELQSIEIRDWKPDMKSLNELAERATWSFSTAATKPPKQQQPKSQQPQKKGEGESK
jgi:hypothetical protein